MKPTQIYRLFFACALVAVSYGSLSAQMDGDTMLTKRQIDSILATAKVLFAENDTVIASFLHRIDYVSLRIGQVDNLLRRSIDTFDIFAEWPDLMENIAIVDDNLELNRKAPNLRSLYVSRVTLTQLEHQLEKWQVRLAGYSERFVKTDIELYQFWQDTILRTPPADSTLKRLYTEQVLLLLPKLTKVRQLNQKNLKTLGNLQNRVLRVSARVKEMLDEVEYSIKREQNALTKRELNNIWRPDSTAKPHKTFSEVLQLSKQRNLRVLQLYLRQNWLSLVMVLGMIAFYFIWLKVIIRRIRDNHTSHGLILSQVRFAAPHSLVAAMVIAFSVAPYLSAGPPYVYIELWWVALLVVIGILILRLWPLPLFIGWLVFFALFAVYGFINLLVESSYAEYRLLFTLGIATIALGGVLLYVVHRVPYNYPGFIKPLLWCFIAAHILALLFLVFGRVTLAKIVATSAMFNFMLAVNLYIFAEILTETLFLQMESTRSNDAWRALFDLQAAQRQFRSAFWWVAALFWVVALLNNLSVLDIVNANVLSFLFAERHLGSSSFTFGSIGLFVLIIWLTNLLSRLLVSFFGGVNNQFVGARKNKLGTSMLLVRLGLLGGGFLLAMTASGIPLDNVAIVIGALGVGIGFGLQNIVNNLVSGIILAFEKPVQVGDIIEVGTRTGIVKEIGIRASKLSTYDGSEVIIPNGDLLSQHLINWTMNNRSRRVEIFVGVAYGSDLEKARLVITQALQQQEDILSIPAPMVLVDSLADNAVNIRVLFWPTDIDKILPLRSNVISDIHNGLKDAGIEIPFPQRDLHIKSMPEEFAGKKAEKKKSGENGDSSPKTSKGFEDVRNEQSREKEDMDIED